MSEYQYYEFLAVDRPLTPRQMEELRAFSTRASITPTSFVNEYHWGDFRGNVRHFMDKYFDAFVYFANWGTHILHFRLPKADMDTDLARRYCDSNYAHLRQTGEHLVLEFRSDDEEGEWEGDEAWMPSLAPLRADLLAGDLRALYIGWLQGIACHEVEEHAAEPPVPPGLRELTAPLRALADFLQVDEALIEAAAEASPPMTLESNSAAELQSWVKALSAADKDSLLCRLMQEPAVAVQRDVLRRFREAPPPGDRGRSRRSYRRRTCPRVEPADRGAAAARGGKEGEGGSPSSKRG